MVKSINLFGYSAGQLELELSARNQLLQTKDSDLMAAKHEVYWYDELKLSEHEAKWTSPGIFIASFAWLIVV